MDNKKWETFKYLSGLPKHSMTLNMRYKDENTYLRYDLFYDGVFIDALNMKYPTFEDLDEQGYQDWIKIGGSCNE